MSDGGLVVEFCGERHEVAPGAAFVIGREADLSIDDNPYLHRQFLAVAGRSGLYWLANVGSQLTATVSDADARLQAWLSPGAQLPLVFERTIVRFTAGPTVYELEILQAAPVFAPIGQTTDLEDGTTTIGRQSFTRDQHLLIVALAEPALRQNGRGASLLPSSAAAARRLGWGLTKFNRKLDNVCAKLTKAGVRGLHGGPDRLASGRRARLVEYALAARLVVPGDLALLDRPRRDAVEVGDD
jgi:hypothetical protein